MLKKIGIVCGLLSLVILSSCAYFTKNYYTNPEENFQKAQQVKPYDAVIIPGYPHYKDSTTIVIKARVNWAVYLYKKGYAKNVIFSGSAVYTPYVEAKIMALYAEKMGIPKEHIFIENLAEHSIENVYYSIRLGEKQGFKTFALGSDPVQSSFLMDINRHRYHLTLDFLPFVTDSLLPFSQALPSINQEEAFVDNFIPLPEKKSLYKRMQGTKGKKVKKMLKQEKKELKKG